MSMGEDQWQVVVLTGLRTVVLDACHGSTGSWHFPLTKGPWTSHGHTFNCNPRKGGYRSHGRNSSHTAGKPLCFGSNVLLHFVAIPDKEAETIVDI